MLGAELMCSRVQRLEQTVNDLAQGQQAIHGAVSDRIMPYGSTLTEF